jgi:hypothetical protein
VTGAQSTNRGPNNVEALVNLQHSAKFEEHFYLVVIEKVDSTCGAQESSGTSVLHMWCIAIASHGMFLGNPVDQSFLRNRHF